MGNWGPELMELAGGRCALGNPNAHSAATSWQSVIDANPEVLVVAPCGFGLERILARDAQLPDLAAQPGWEGLEAVHSGQVYVADSNRYFNRSGPTVFESGTNHSPGSGGTLGRRRADWAPSPEDYPDAFAAELEDKKAAGGA
jgi:ABC-type hemin transport system substrate-binding protein